MDKSQNILCVLPGKADVLSESLAKQSLTSKFFILPCFSFGDILAPSSLDPALMGQKWSVT